jgi:hypothetical protein
MPGTNLNPVVFTHIFLTPNLWGTLLFYFFGGAEG